MKHGKVDKVDEARLRELAAAYGANPQRWPEHEREAAEIAAQAQGSDTTALFAHETRLDRWLDEAPDVLPSDALLRRVREIPLRHEVHAATWWPFGKMRNVLTLLATAAALGVLVGVAMPDANDGDTEEAHWEELSTLALGYALPEESP